MARQIRAGGPALKVIRDTGPALPRIEHEDIAAALEGVPSGAELSEPLAPITLYAVREELAARLHSSGGRPGLAGTRRRARIPLGEEEQRQLEELAAAISSPGFNPTAGQVASILLRLSARTVARQISKSDSKSAALPRQDPAGNR